MLRKIIIALNSVILQFFYTGIKQELYKLQQYGNDLQAMKQENIEMAREDTGKKYQSNYRLLYFILLTSSIIICQYIYLEYRINTSFRLDKNRLSVIVGLLMFGALALPILLVFSMYYNPSYIGNLLLDSSALDPISDFLNINYFSIITWLSGVYLVCSIVYIMIFNMIHFISIDKVI